MTHSISLDEAQRLAAGVIAGAIEGSSLAEEERAFFRSYQVAGITLFARNIKDGSSKELVTNLQSLSGQSNPLLVCIDQEGGRVARFKQNIPDLGPAQKIFDGLSDSSTLNKITDYAESLARALRVQGINVNFAPVVDILTEPTNSAIGDRVFGLDAETVEKRAGAFSQGLLRGGVYDCLKHFPGQGDAKFDTHKSEAVIAIDEALLRRRELRPFRSLISQTTMVMISHCVYPAFDPEFPASCSKKIITDLLMVELGFDGLVVSDDMTMGAIEQGEDAWLSTMIKSIEAGVDLLLVCRGLDKWEKAIKALADRAISDSGFYVRLRDAYQKVQELRDSISNSENV